jgi:hypothetical protein
MIIPTLLHFVYQAVMGGAEEPFPSLVYVYPFPYRALQSPSPT